jgi:hypothetical protein
MGVAGYPCFGRPYNCSPSIVVEEDLDSEGDYDNIASLSFSRFSRVQAIKVIEYADPIRMSACRLSSLDNKTLKQLLFLVVTDLVWRKEFAELGIRAMMGAKNLFKTYAKDNGDNAAMCLAMNSMCPYDPRSKLLYALRDPADPPMAELRRNAENTDALISEM